VSDHDTVAGIAEAADAAAELGVRLVPAVEISALDEQTRDLHILGYLIDDRDPTLCERLERFRADRERRAEAMAQAIRDVGFELEETVIAARRAQGQSIGRPHLAQAVIAEPANAQRLAAERCTDPSAFLEAYLVEGRPAFRPRTVPSVADSIAAIHQAGGLAVWAHPFFDISDPRAVLASIDRFRDWGIDGVECFYVMHSREQAEFLAECCAQRGLLSTGSSDFHGPHHRKLSRFRAFSTYGREPRLGPLAE